MNTELPLMLPHGGGVEAAAKAWQCKVSDILDLSTGLHPYGPPVGLNEWLKNHADLVGHYPDKDGEPARTALAESFGVLPEQVLMTAGAQAAIEVIFQAMGWSSVAITVPCYSEPIRCAKRAGCEVYTMERGEQLPEEDAIWWTSPDNPFGQAKAFPQGFCGVLDESYMPFSQRRGLGVMPKVIRLGSLTKTFCIPGLRLGYVIADALTIQRLQTWLPPWSTSTLGLHLLPLLLPESDQRDEQIVTARQRLSKLLGQNNWEVYPSEASFILARPTKGTPDFTTFKILVREFPEWPQLEGWIRFGFPSSEPMWQRLEKSLADVKKG